MTSEAGHGRQSKRRRLNSPADGPYTIRPVFEDVPLSAEDGSEDVHITAVEYWDNNLYIGSSASEVLHFVAIPPDPDSDDETTYILASRIQPSSVTNQASDPSDPGVQQIVLLPSAGKACILCNGIATFYSLPELSPAFGTTKVASCRWIGGLDENIDDADGREQVVMIAAASRVMLVRIGEEARRIRNIEFPGCLRSARRDTIACVADNRSYSLLEVEHQQKIPLFPISSLEQSESSRSGKIEDLPPAPLSPLPARMSSLAHRPLASPEPRGHERSSSLNVLRPDTGRQLSSRPLSSDLSGFSGPDLPAQESSRPGSVSPSRRGLGPPSPRSATPDRGKALPPPPKARTNLKPHIASPTPSEFLLTTGTEDNEPGVGLFVNVDGDVVRGTIEFASYPEAVAIDRPARDGSNMPPADDSDQDISIVAIVRSQDFEESGARSLEIHSLGDSMGARPDTIGLEVGSQTFVGLRSSLSSFEQSFPSVLDSLRLVRLKLSNISGTLQGPGEPDNSLPTGWEPKREKEELAFARSLAQGRTRTILWNGNKIWCLTRNPLAVQLETKLSQAVQEDGKVHSRLVMALMAQIRDREATTEADFLSLAYVRQKASVTLFVHVYHDRKLADREAELRLVENLLMESNLDPRIVLLMVPFLREGVLEGPKGIWVQRGVSLAVEKALGTSETVDNTTDLALLGMIRRYLAAWQGKRGFGSITDEKQVFDSVDTALLHTLLHLDQELPVGSSAASSVRAKLNNVVDNWRGDFERAVALLEHYQRLYVLSRLYQSRKLSKDVLATWRRIINGESDPSEELSPAAAEVRIRKYLPNLRNAQLVEEYGVLLAQRNPELAIQFFTDDSSRVKFEPSQLTELLKENAPHAVQQYLEYLVFNKGMPQYGDDLIGYYLDSMLSVLESSEEARTSLADSYSTYRALSAPKPTYLTFITQNAPPESWWQSRLRLLQLLSGGSNYSSSSTSKQLSYSIDTVLERLAPFSKYLVSESIILDARQGHHLRALDLLTHGLGDYDSAIRYCYFGGPAPTTSQPVDASLLPDFATQRSLYGHLLTEFLKIESPSDSLERTSDLLVKFAAWFDPLEILEKIPAHWSIEHLSEFFTRTLRKLRTERDESLVLRGLAAAENLKKQVEWVEGCEKLGAMLEEMEGVLKSAKGNGRGDDDDQPPSGPRSPDEGARSIAEVQDILLRDELVVS